MKLFNVGALRPAADDARLSAASDLVQRTLAQHGLLPGSQTPQSGCLHNGGLPNVDGLMARFTQNSGGFAPAHTEIPEGAQFLQKTYTHAEGSRMYRTYIPASADMGITGVVMMLHGCTQSPEDFAAGTGMNALAEQHRIAVVYPAQSRGDNAQSCWNWFSRGDQQRGRGEPAILAGLASQICGFHGVERDRTFVAGLSAGGAMASILGETYPDVFAAVGTHSGLPVGAAKDIPSAFAAMGGKILDTPIRARNETRVRTIVFHGTADATVSPKNSDIIVQRALGTNMSQSIETNEQGQENGRSFTRYISTDTDGTAVVEYWRIDGQGHAWSGGSNAGTYTDPKGPDASAEMLRFFFDNADEVN
ncbi:PHB depolymerase family esterase [Sulfitobacter sp. F26169L]|uniref:extracellular catalytic domain type 1 short-chain-length polyhydroxyalkanoate depolymerase n=1 Tax=Sulfitobacter sp. F26169L TaxID=2996015 RepID=UPI002260EE33|nr:PHB depolymerase family esterase [Sulfitobacter sp. F26169L]MCX7567708.1 PHB depolymerase family esterase [Sulfitobacter sp. F26169L]